MAKGHKVQLAVTVEPELVKQLDSLRHEDVPRSRQVERVLTQYVISMKTKEEELETVNNKNV
jgi:hypothetical protein